MLEVEPRVLYLMEILEVLLHFLQQPSLGAAVVHITIVQGLVVQAAGQELQMEVLEVLEYLDKEILEDLELLLVVVVVAPEVLGVQGLLEELVLSHL